MTTLDHLITSRTLTKLIHHFCNFYEPLSTREIARRLNEDSGNVHKMIVRLKRAGILEKRGDGEDAAYYPVESHDLECLRYLHSEKTK